MTREQLEISIQSNMPTNGVGFIKAVNTRQVAEDMADYVDYKVDHIDIGDLGDRMDSAEDDIDALEGRATAVEGRMTTAEGDIDNLQDDVDAIPNNYYNKTQADDKFETISNKATNFNTINDVLFPTTKAVADYVASHGGGGSYTAGDGIDITNDVISVVGKQDTLVSGTNIKTINNESILGSGNISIQGGGSYTAGSGIDITNDVISVVGKVDSSTYNDFVTNTNTALSNKADKATTYTKTETDTALATKQDSLVSGTNIKTINNENILGSGNISIQSGTNYTAGSGIDITADVISVVGKVDTTTFNNYTTTTDATLATKADKATTYTKTETDAELALKADKSTTYTKTETDNLINNATSSKQDTLVSGTNIKTINNGSILGSGNISIPVNPPIVVLTQSEYDALVDKDNNTIYIIK